MLPPSRVTVTRDRHVIIGWLSACALLVACMVLVGGYTRLSGSGLSITEWKPLHGVIPPMNIQDWQEEFAHYRASPQYVKINNGMTLAEFHTIFWPEYGHRVLGRLVGAVFFLPFLMFLLRGSLCARLSWRLLAIFALGGLQGAIGWLMVKSGLQDTPSVSPLRLALHLATALAILGLLLWTLLDIVASGKWQVASKHRAILTTYHLPLATYRLWFSALCLQIILGAFMAGLHAGLIYNTWPDMNGQFIPDGLLVSQKTHTNFLENIALIQFLHRNVAMALAFGFALWWYFARAYVKHYRLVRQCAAMAALISVQFTLGVLTLLHRAPLNLALAHQMTAVALFAAGVVLYYELRIRITGHDQLPALLPAQHPAA